MKPAAFAGVAVTVVVVSAACGSSRGAGATVSNGNCEVDGNTLTGLCIASDGAGACVTHAADATSRACVRGTAVTETRSPACDPKSARLASRQHECFFIPTR